MSHDKNVHDKKIHDKKSYDKKENENIIEGRNAVMEAFRSGKPVDKLYVLDGCQDGAVRSIIREARKHDTILNFVEKDRLNQLSENGKHQGVIASVAAYEYAEVEDMLKLAEEKGEDPFLIILDNIEDPHNLGAIIRTANQAGAHGVIIPKRRAVGLTATVARTSAGALNYTPVAKVTNLVKTMEDLKKKGLWFVCADMDGDVMYDVNMKGPIGLVIGNEGEGVGRLVKDTCDFTASITYSDETVHRFAKLNPAAEDFRIFWDNAYGIHHLYEDKQDYLIEILMECKKEGHPDMVYKFSSTSKISFPGSGIAAIAASDANLADIRKQMRIQTIGHDKLNQLRHARYFGNIHGMVQHMKKHADILRPKFDIVLKTLDKELGGLGIGSWLAPRGCCVTSACDQIIIRYNLCTDESSFKVRMNLSSCLRCLCSFCDRPCTDFRLTCCQVTDKSKQFIACFDQFFQTRLF